MIAFVLVIVTFLFVTFCHSLRLSFGGEIIKDDLTVIAAASGACWARGSGS